MSQVIAFYGFKGGSGRSHILANIACVMAADGKRVLVIDLDLEAPGVGDYYHLSAPNSYEASRTAMGILDFLIDRKDFEIDNRLIPVTIPGRDTKESSGSIHILGPGSHVTEGAFPQAYPQRVTSFDWGSFLNDAASRYLTDFGKRLQNHPNFDFILIDARTGYNVASIILLQHWATQVVGVGTMSMQSIDGLARIMPVFEAVGLRCHYVLSKYPVDSAQGTKEDEELTFKNRLIEAYHPPLAGHIYKLPFLKELTRGDSDLWERHPATFWRNLLTGSAATKDQEAYSQKTELRDYCQATINLYKSLSLTPSEIDPVQVTNVWARPGIGLDFEKGSGQLAVPKIRERIQIFLQRVRDYCAPPQKINEPATMPTPRASSDVPSGNPKDSVPTVYDLSDLALEAREYARLLVAAVLKEDEEKEKQEQAVDDGRRDRRETIREKNSLAILPISPELISEKQLLKELEQPVQELEHKPQELVQEETNLTGGSPSSPAPQILDRKVWAAFGSVIVNPGPLENQRLIEAAHDYAGGIGLTKRQTAALDLAKRIQVCYESESAEVDNTRALGNALGEALDGHGLDLPRRVGFTEWNALDAWALYVGIATQPELLAHLEQQVENLRQRVFSELLQSDARPEDVGQFRAYLNTTILVRRRMLHFKERGQPPHSLSSLITPVQKQRLLEVSGATSPDAATLQTVSDVHRAALAIELELYSGGPSAAIPGLRQLAAALVKPQHPLAKEQRAGWFSLLRGLSTLAHENREDGSSTWFTRLALQAYWSGRATQGRDDRAADCAVSLALAKARIGLILLRELVVALQQSSSWPAELFQWWPAADFVECGDYRKASYILEKLSEPADALFWLHECAVQTANLPLVEQTFQKWLGSVVVRHSYHDLQWTWLTMRESHTMALLAQSEAEKAKDVLDDALVVVATRKERKALALKCKLEVRRILLDSILGRVDPKSTTVEAKHNINEYEKHLLFLEAEGCCDREFVEHLKIDKWGDNTVGLGMFSGYEAPSGRRQRLAQTLVEFAEILYRAEKREEAKQVATEILERVLSRYDESDTLHFLAPRRLAYCYPVAASYAFLGIRDHAVRHRDADCRANGAERDAFYQRIFRLVGWHANPWNEPELPATI